MGKITIESASANGKDRCSQVISSELNIKSKQFKLYRCSLNRDVAPWRSILERGSLELGCGPVEVYSR